MQTTRKGVPLVHRVPRRALGPAAVIAAVLLSISAVAACSGSSESDSGTAGSSASEADFAAAVPAADKSVDGVLASDASDTSDGLDQASGGGSGDDSASSEAVAGGPALIKTAAIDLKSSDIQGIVDKIYGLALTTGGRVDSEQTSTNDNGVVEHSRVQVRVPVARFDDAVARIYGFAPDHAKQTSTEDVTARLADVTSRVESAQASIAQLRKLFDQATELGQVIQLERELSSREADLEALQAQHRALAAQTTMSTILVTITLPAPPAENTDTHQAGFVSGINKGWDAMVTFVVGASHFLGLVLPLGALCVVVLLLGWPLYRRVSFRRPGAPQPSE
jgi:hypothetical protein